MAAVRRQQCVIRAAAVGSSAAAMFPLFITHDEYFVRCSGSGGGSTIFLICPAMNFLVDKNSVKYSLHTKIVPQEGYGTRVPTSKACGMWDICAAAFAQPFLNKVFQFGIDCTRVLTSNACDVRRHLCCSRCTAFFEQSIPVWNKLSYPTYVEIQYWYKIVLIRNQYILHTYIRN